jgi:uncharacterized protein (DUF1810 family)
MANLDRFREAQDVTHSGFAVALRELQAGRKTSHWIWYVFPQLSGLGRSSTAVYYGLTSAEEAADYLRDEVLGDRLVQAAAVVGAHLTGVNGRPVDLEELMGSQIDAVKLVSSMTLFAHVAITLHAGDPQPRFAAMADHADTILTIAAAQGYRRCSYTEGQVSRPGM